MIMQRFNPEDLNRGSDNSDDSGVTSPIHSFVLPEHEESIIKVIGVGGGGCHAVRSMQIAGIRGVDFMVVNTDKQALKSNPVQKKMQIGTELTRGLGVGGDALVGEAAANESREEIRKALDDGTQMVFITAGMGGGTGTGASPVIAEIAQSLGILTVGIVTLPFSSEGTPKMERAFRGIEALKQHCDTVLVILNDKLVEVFGALSYKEAFLKADDVLLTGAKSIAEIITVEGHPNVDFNDVKSVIKNSRTAVMGTGVASGPDACRIAAAAALESPLLNNFNIAGAKHILVGLFYGKNPPLITETEQVNLDIQEMTGHTAELKFSAFEDEALGENIRVTVIATGFEEDDPWYGYAVKGKTNATGSDQVASGSSKVLNIYNSSGQQALNHQSSTAPKPITTQPATAQPTPSRPLFTKEEVIAKPVYQPVADKKPTEQRTTINIDGTMILNGLGQPAEDPTESLFQDKSASDDRLKLLAEERKLRQEKQRRIEEIKSMGVSGLTNEAINLLNEPTYKRKDIDLPQNGNQGGRQASRTTINMDNELRDNNRFLHDNVD